MSEPLPYLAIEAGGTKFVCAVLDPQGAILAQTRVATERPEQTLEAVAAFARDQGGRFAGVGLAAFGPVDLDLHSPSFGKIRETPKPHWSWTDLRAPFIAMAPTVRIDTDVNAAALAESYWGAAQRAEVCAYVTVGTGLGCGLVVAGRPLHGVLHPEMGHMRPWRSAQSQAAFAGVCPFHGDCYEGLASGVALRARWGVGAEDLPNDHPAWDSLADDLGQFCANIVLSAAPHKIIFGGGVMTTTALLPKVRERMMAWLNGYPPADLIATDPDYLCAPGLGAQAGLLGAFALCLDPTQARGLFPAGA